MNGSSVWEMVHRPNVAVSVPQLSVMYMTFAIQVRAGLADDFSDFTRGVRFSEG